MDDGWRLVTRGDVAPHWSGLYVTMNPKGYLHISGQTWARLGSPEAFHILYNQILRRLMLKPVERSQKHAYPAGISGKHGGKVIRAHRLMTEFNIRPADTIEFITPKIDEDGCLVVDFSKIRISPKSHSQCRARQAEWKS